MPMPDAPAPSAAGIAPLLRQLMEDYAATGLPPAYVPRDPTTATATDDNEETNT